MFLKGSSHQRTLTAGSYYLGSAKRCRSRNSAFDAQRSKSEPHEPTGEAAVGAPLAPEEARQT